uniref:DUF223 domain-containing protein n=1 Tax=Strongyloides venezuelensis TaxID=75913 RepID=A0A0K0FRZ1_STRVS
MCVRDYCYCHFNNFGLEVQELRECYIKSYIIKPPYDLTFTKDSFVAYECGNFNFKCAIGVVKSIINVNDKMWLIIKPLKIKSTILDQFPVNSNERILGKIKENTMFDYYYCLEDFMSEDEATSYRLRSYFVNESRELVIVNVDAIIYKCLIINTPGRKSFCCPIIAPFEHNEYLFFVASNVENFLLNFVI